MSDKFKNSPDNYSKESLFADMTDLAMNENIDSEGFLKSVSALMESEKYEEITTEIVGDEVLPEKSVDMESSNVVDENKSEIFVKFREEGWDDESDDWGVSEDEEDDWGTSDDEEDEREHLVEFDDWGVSDDDDWGEDDDTETVADNEETGAVESESTSEEIKRKKRNNIINNIIRVACLIICVYCLVEIGKYFYSSYRGKKEINELKETVMDKVNMDVPVIQEPVVNDIKFPDEVIYASNSTVYKDEISNEWANAYSNLVELNSDCVGWLQIDDSNIAYPVMYTPEQYDYYLYRDFERDYISRGLPFLAEGTLLNVSQNYIVYGHNMRDDTGFSDLTKYLNREWLQNHKYAYFYTAFGEGVYEVMDVVITKVFTVEDECFKYYKYSGELNEDEFNTYVYYMDKMSSIDTGVEAVYGDQLLSLSTCYRVYDEEGRLVVVFKRVQ